MKDDDVRRRHMVETQLRPSNVTDPAVLDAMGAVPRTAFVPAQLKSVAYSDDDLSLPDGRFLLEPLVLARLLELAAPTNKETALVVGCDTGYSAVVMARLVGTVFAAVDREQIDDVDQRASKLDAMNVLTVGAAYPGEGHAEKAPYDVILVAGRVREVPSALLEQLAEGGRLVAVVGGERVGRGTLITKVHGHLGRRQAFDAASPPLRAPEAAPGFQF